MISPWRQWETLLGLGLAWKTPLALVLLLVPIGLLLLARIPARPLEMATGALALWRKVVLQEHPRSGRARWVPPNWVLWACLSLVFGVLGLAGPVSSGKPPTRVWTVVLDRSPGLLLPWRSSAADSKSVRSRSEIALGLAKKYLSEVTAAGDRVRWEAPGREPLELAVDALPDFAWRSPLRSSTGGDPAWERYTEAGCIWVTDRRPDQDPGEAAVLLSGGAAVPGAISVAGDQCLSWSEDAPLELVPRRGGTLVFKHVPVSVAEQAEQRMGRPLPALLEDLVRAWARSRGLAIVRDAAPKELKDPKNPKDTGPASSEARSDLNDDVVLVVEGFGTNSSWANHSDTPSKLGTAGAQGELEAGHAGGPGMAWERMEFEVRESGFAATGTCLIGTLVADGLRAAPEADRGEGSLSVRWWGDASDASAAARLPLLSSQAGRVRFSIVDLDPPSGDPAAFAVRVAQLLDQALLLPPGVIPLRARRAAGPQTVEPGQSPDPEDRLAVDSDFPLGAWLAGFAALAAFVALVGKW